MRLAHFAFALCSSIMLATATGFAAIAATIGRVAAAMFEALDPRPQRMFAVDYSLLAASSTGATGIDNGLFHRNRHEAGVSRRSAARHT